jgi:hypothetical protein
VKEIDEDGLTTNAPAQDRQDATRCRRNLIVAGAVIRAAEYSSLLCALLLSLSPSSSLFSPSLSLPHAHLPFPSHLSKTENRAAARRPPG